jgi:glycosyltransferase involved in cell wall biosynthesis
MQSLNPVAMELRPLGHRRADHGMRVGIDLTALLPQHTGVDNFLLALVRHLGALDRDTAYTVFVNAEDAATVRALLPAHMRVRAASLRPRLLRLLFQQVLLPLATYVLRLDVVHSPSFIMPMWRGRARHVLTIHDLSSFSLPQAEVALRRSAPYRFAVLNSIRRADLVCVSTTFVRDQVAEHVPELPPERVRMVPLGLGEAFHPQDPDAVRPVLQRLGVRAPYILFVGTIQPRKNLEMLVRAYRKLLAADSLAEHLVLAGRLGWSYEPLLELCREPGLRERVQFLHYVDQADLPLLYAGASLLVYPSLEEGFGFPPLEAMATGVPVIVSDAAALRETTDDAAERVPAGDIDGWADAMHRLLADEDLRARRREAGIACAARFRWEETAARTLACYRELAG